MRIKDHIAYRFLTDPKLTDELLEVAQPNEFRDVKKNGQNAKKESLSRLGMLYDVIKIHDQKAYYITDTVIDKLDMLKVSKKNGVYDWTIFKNIESCRLTFIFKNNALLRVRVVDDVIMFAHVDYEYYNKIDKAIHKTPGVLHLVNFWVDRNTGEQCDHFSHIDVQSIERFVYHLLCFFFLSENEEIIVQPGKKHLGRKQPGHLFNETEVPITIVNSRWNVTVIRTEGFAVRGHFAIRWAGKGKTEARMVFIEPFQKKGYIRRAGKELDT